jgi:bilirubin oxidase
MFSKLASLALASCLCAGAIAQRTLEYDIPPEEALALSQLVDDDDPIFSIQKGKEISPEFPLIYRVPLPIPPVKQPKQ